MRLGTYWFVRIGIAMVLMGLVFFATLAYQNYISKLGPGGKLALLYLAGGMLLGAGWWWQRKAAKESLKNYAQVLFAGGLAAVYFTTYAAHHVPELLVIHSPLLAGVLLLGWAGFMVGVADHKKSEVLAFFAVGLAYYTSIIIRVGLFTLYSNLILTIAAVTFLVRNRWAALSFASLLATYAAYAFWRFFNGAEWHWPPPEDGLWTGACFLISYWVVFTGAVFLSRDQKFAGQNRAGFLTLNNGALFSMFVLTMYQVHSGRFWEFLLIYGTALLVMAELARRLLSSEPLAKHFYLTQGLLLVTAGFIAKFSGMNLALILAVESVMLLTTGLQRRNRILLAGAYITAALAVGWGMDGMKQFDSQGLWLGMGLGVLMLWNAVWCDRRAAAVPGALLRGRPAYFAALALLVWLVAIWDNTTRENFPLVAAGAGLLLTLSIYLLQIPELPLLAQSYLLLAEVKWLFDAFGGPIPLPWWNPVVMVAVALGFTYWWQRQKALELSSQTDSTREGLRLLPVLGKALLLLAVAWFAIDLTGGWSLDISQPKPNGFWLPLLLAALMLADSVLAHRRSASGPPAALRLQPAYSTVLALGVGLAITWHHTSHELFPLVLALEGILLTWSIYLLRVREISLLSQSYLLLAQFAWVARALALGHNPPWWNPLALVGLTLVLSHWWQRQKTIVLRPAAGQVWQGLYALAIVALIYVWLNAQVSAPTWLALTSLLAVGLTAYGVITRAWWVAIFGQFFLLISGMQFVWQLAQAKPNWPLPLATIAALGALSLGAVTWFKQKPDPSERVSTPLLQLATVYRWVALAMSLWWVCAYVPDREQVWALALPGLCLFGWAGWRRSREALASSAAFTGAALVLFWLPLLEGPRAYVPDLVVILALLAQRQIARRLPERYSLPSGALNAVIVVGGLSLWLFITRWVLEYGKSSYLTPAWSVLALAMFTAGLALRERVYRWLGLAVLACSLGWVVFIDLWKLGTIYRVLSVMALGTVLLVLGFIYNKYQEKLKDWL